ncbi:helix-turn-helix transcriptional regulator [Streptomyces sp. NPDC055709]
MALLAGERLFVGREAELRRLRECAQLVRSGQPWVVLVDGEAGMGKTALVREWLAGEMTFNPLSGFGDASESDLAFGLVGQLIARVPRVRRERFVMLRDGGPPAGASSVQVGGQLLGLLDDLEHSGPVAMIVEDVQWADSASLNALRFVLRRLEADQVLMVLTARSPVSDEIRKLAEDHRWGMRLSLTGLGDDSVAQLIRHTTGKAAGFQAAQWLREFTDGNPLYLRTVLAEIPSSLLRGATVAKAPWPVPASLAAAVHRQLDVLPASSRALAEAAAVLDAPVSLNTVGRLAGVSDPTAALQPALAANLMRWWPTEPTTPVMITHALQRDAVIEALTPQRRRRLHHDAVELVDEAAAAWRHRVAAADGPDDHLASQLEHAAQGCLADGATERAATMLLWASELATTRPERERLLLTAAIRLLLATQVAPVQGLLPRVQACNPGPLRSVAMGSYAMLCGALDEAEAELAAAFEASAKGTAKENWIAAIAGAYLAATHLFRGNWHQQVEVARQVLVLHQPHHVVDYIAKSNVADGLSRLEGPRTGLRELERLARLPSAAQVTSANAWLLTVRGEMRVLSGMPTSGREDLTQALRLSEGEVGQGLEELAGSHLAVACYWTGAWDEAAVHADLALATATTAQRLYALGPTCSYAAWVPAGRGEVARAQELLRTADRHVLPYTVDEVLLGWAVETQASADWPAMLQAVERKLRSGHVRMREVLWKPLQVEAFLRTGHSQAAAAVTELAAMTGSYPCLRLCLAWLSGELAHARGDLAGARTHYEEGIALPVSPDDHVLHRAFLEQAYGRLLAVTGQTAQARTWLEHACARYMALRARPFLVRCQTDLTTVSAPVPDPDVVPELAGLTDREHDIACLVGQGMTNKEIAERLFVSSKTVEYHLSHIYAKCNLSSRRKLRDLVHQQLPRIE